MNSISKSLDIRHRIKAATNKSYSLLDSELLELNKKIAEKKQEFEPLNNAISATQKEIRNIENSIELAPGKLASGELTTEDVLNLHDKLNTLKKSLVSFEEARKIQESSLIPFNDEIRVINEAISEKKKEKRKELPVIYAGKIDKQAVNECLMVFVANSENIRFNHRNPSLLHTEFFEFFRDNFGFPGASESHKFCEHATLEALESEV